jgi:hypothetical protein
MNSVHEERDEASARAHDLIRRELHNAPASLHDAGDVVMVSDVAPPWVIPHALVTSIVAALAGPDVARHLEGLEVPEGRVRVLALIGPAVAVTTIRVERMQRGGEA